MMNTPPKTKLTFNVGFVGHRNLPNANIEALKKQVNAVLLNIKTVALEVQAKHKDLFVEEAPELRVLSMLAEGADRLLTECGLDLGYHFQCALPMSRKEYEKDFETAESKKAFDRLLSKAESVLEFEACTEVRSRAYQDCGHVLLGQSDILVTIWDGKDSGMVGGTSDMIAHATQHDIPIIWIDSAAEHSIKFMYGDSEESNWEQELQKVVRGILSPWGDSSDNEKLYRLYIDEDIDRKSRAKLYQHFISFVKWKRKKGSAYNPEKKDEFYKKKYLRYYDASDRLAMFYRDIYRSCGILRQVLPFLASIGLAIGFYAVLLGGPKKLPISEANVLNIISIIGFLMQAVCFLLIIILSKVEKKKYWHKKFTDYRMLSELLRQMEYLAPFGIIIRGLRAPAFNKSINISWVSAQFRAIVRQAGLPNVMVDAKSIEMQTKVLNEKVISGQIDYHKSNAGNMLLVNRRLEKFGFAVYYIGIVVVALRVVERILITGSVLTGLNPDQQNYTSTFFNMLSLVIPLFSALSFAISSQEGFDRISNISESMKQKLINLESKIANERCMNFNTYKNLSQRYADLMLSEFSDWNSFIMSKNISDH